jgi:hypothetical protein
MSPHLPAAGLRMTASSTNGANYRSSSFFLLFFFFFLAYVSNQQKEVIEENTKIEDFISYIPPLLV